MEENKPEVTVLSVELSQAVQADALVNSGMELAYTGITKICEGVKLMHDGKLYRQLGFKNFEEYCKNKGFTKQYGNQLVRIARMMKEENGKSIFHFENLGVAKLLELATLQPEQREEIIQTVDVEGVTVKELKAEINTLKQNNQKLKDEQKQSESALQKKQDEITELEKQVQELENRPVEVYHSEEDKQEIERLTIQNEALEEQRAELEQKVCEYQNQEQLQPEKTPEYQNLMEAMNNASKEWKRMYDKLQDDDEKEINKLKRDHHDELRQKDEEIKALQSQIAEKSAEPEESLESKQFRIQLVTISNNLSQLFDFLCDHPQDMFLSQLEKLLKDAENSLNDIRKQVQA